MTIRVLATVSRSYKSWSTMRGALEKVHAEHPDAVLVHGDAPKGDRDAAGIWRSLGGETEAWPAKWSECGWDCPHATHRRVNKAGKEYCPYAGLRRSGEMVESGINLTVAFLDPNSTKGAFHCAQLAEDAGIPVVRYVQEAGA